MILEVKVDDLGVIERRGCTWWAYSTRGATLEMQGVLMES
jgi:hypothetical protein